MMTKQKRAQPAIGSDAFWEMVSLTIDGQLASCVSCVEYFYFQSTLNAWLFLEACAAAGLVQKVPLLDLFGNVGPRTDPGQLKYDEPIYLSAPEYQAKSPSDARDRLKKTKAAVDLALRLFYEELRGDTSMVGAAYGASIRQKKLRYDKVARKRIRVRLSPLAEVRLVHDGFRAKLGAEGKSQAINDAVTYIRGFAGKSGSVRGSDDVGDELETFMLEFLRDPGKIKDHRPVKPAAEVAPDYWVKWLPVILNLAWGRVEWLRKHDPGAEKAFSAKLQDALEKAIRREAGHPAERSHLESLRDDWGWLMEQQETVGVPPWLLAIANPPASLWPN